MTDEEKDEINEVIYMKLFGFEWMTRINESGGKTAGLFSKDIIKAELAVLSDDEACSGIAKDAIIEKDNLTFAGCVNLFGDSLGIEIVENALIERYSKKHGIVFITQWNNGFWCAEISVFTDSFPKIKQYKKSAKHKADAFLFAVKQLLESES